jgi:hypothetical protein
VSRQSGADTGYSEDQKVEFVKEVFQYLRAREILSFLERTRRRQGESFSGINFNAIATEMGGSRSLTIEMLGYLLRKGYVENSIERREHGGQNRILSMYRPTRKADAIAPFLL